MNAILQNMVHMRKSWQECRGLDVVPVARLYCESEIAALGESPEAAFSFPR
jgi:hypothetical protein